MNNERPVWPRGVPQEPALRVGRSGLRITREMYEALGSPRFVDIVFERTGSVMIIGLREGHRHRVWARQHDHALSVSSRPLGRMVPESCRGRWWLARDQDGLWAARIVAETP